jgi:hypothetical protein
MSRLIMIKSKIKSLQDHWLLINMIKYIFHKRLHYKVLIDFATFKIWWAFIQDLKLFTNLASKVGFNVMFCHILTQLISLEDLFQVLTQQNIKKIHKGHTII